MKVIEIINPGQNSLLEIVDRPSPKLNEESLLVKVEAFAINRADILQRKGHYPPPDGVTDIPGLELSGTIVQCGPAVTRFKAGDRIYGLVSGGAYAEYCLVDQNLATIIPPNMSTHHAAALPEALVTVHATAFELGQLTTQQTLLIHGAGSGLSTLAVQMAKAAGAKVISTVGDQSKKEKALALGFDQVFDYRHHTWFEDIVPNSIHTIVDFIGADYVQHHLKLLAARGRLIQIACMKGHRFEASLLPILSKQLLAQGFTLRSQTIEEKAKLWAAAHLTWNKDLANKKVQPVIDSVFSFNDIEQAHRHMVESKHFGKIVINLNR